MVSEEDQPVTEREQLRQEILQAVDVRLPDDNAEFTAALVDEDVMPVVARVVAERDEARRERDCGWAAAEQSAEIGDMLVWLHAEAVWQRDVYRQRGIDAAERYTKNMNDLRQQFDEQAWKLAEVQAERDEARNQFLDHYNGTAPHLDRIRELEEALRTRTGERDTARALFESEAKRNREVMADTQLALWLYAEQKWHKDVRTEAVAVLDDDAWVLSARVADLEHEIDEAHDVVSDLRRQHTDCAAEKVALRSRVADLEGQFARARVEWAVQQSGNLITPFEDEETARHMVVAMRHPLQAEVVCRSITDWHVPGVDTQPAEPRGEGPDRGEEVAAKTQGRELTGSAVLEPGAVTATPARPSPRTEELDTSIGGAADRAWFAAQRARIHGRPDAERAVVPTPQDDTPSMIVPRDMVHEVPGSITGAIADAGIDAEHNRLVDWGLGRVSDGKEDTRDG